MTILSFSRGFNLPRSIGIKALLVLAFISFIFQGIGQNITRPNIEGPSGLQVNSYTGSLFYQRNDLYLPGLGLSLDISFSYNSADRDKDWGYGYGWSFFYNQFYTKATEGNGLIFQRNDGRKDKYELKGNAYAAPKGIFDELTSYDGNKFRLRAKNGTEYFFENASHGKLTRIKDRNGNEITLSYADKFLTTITDASGRSLSFLWANTRVVEIKSVALSPARAIQFAYNGSGSLISVKNPLNKSIHYSYGPDRVMSSLTDGNGNTTHIVYYSNSAVAKLVSCQLEQSIAYNREQNKTYLSEKGGGRSISTEYFFDKEGRLAERTGNCCGYKNGYGYDEQNNISSITDANGNTTRYSYDKRGNVLVEMDPFRNSIFYTHESVYNQVTSSTDKAGNKTAFSYDTKGNLTDIVYPLNSSRKYTYDERGNRLTAIDGKGNKTTYGYDANGYLTSLLDPAEGLQKFIYDAWGNVETKWDANDNKTTYSYDALNQLSSQTDAMNGVTKYTYDDNGNVLSLQDANGNISRTRYDPYDRVISVRDALEKTTSLVRDAMGNVTSQIDANGHATKLTYDNLNRMLSQINAAGEQTLFGYDGNGNRTSITYPNGNTVHVKYDALNRIIETRDNTGLIAAHTYDANSNKLTDQDGKGNTTHYKYDALNRLVSKADPLGNASSYTYDANNNLVRETNRNGNSTAFTHDELDRQLTAKDALGHLTSYEYDKAGNMMSVTDARQNKTSYIYDDLNRKTEEIFADKTTRRFSYDPVGNLLSRKDNAGQVTSYIYDKVNRLTSRKYPNGTETFTYDGMGEMLSANNANAVVGFSYDVANRVASESLNGKKTLYAYNVALGTKTITYPGGRIIQRKMNNRNRLQSIKEGDTTVLADFTYDIAGQNIGRRYANNTTTEFAYNGAGRITELNSNPSRFVDLGYVYDKEGSPVAAQLRHQGIATEQYGYDLLGQLTGVKRGNVQQALYNYDGVGNRTTAQINGATATYSLNNMNAYTSVLLNGSVPLLYDGNGNLADDNRNTYTYDSENRLATVSDGNTSVYKYDALGRRISKTIGAKTTKFFFDGQQVIEERDNLDSVEATYVWGTWLDDIVSMTRNKNSYYYHTNAIGSVLSITDASGNVVERYEYDVFGNIGVFNGRYLPIQASGIGNTYTFTGRQYEWEVGLYFYRARIYDPLHGRFLQRDPLGYVDGLGLYAYASNRPVTLIDPFGTEGIDYCAELEKLQGELSWLGMTPGIGFAFDLINAGIYYQQGDYLNTGLSGLSAIPGIGDAFAAARLGLRYGDDAARVLSQVNRRTDFLENAVDVTAKNIKNSENLAKETVGLVDNAGIHGNSLLSTRPTWGYKLYSNDGTFLKNGITSRVNAEARYTKSFMSDKYMEKMHFPNRKAAYDWEFEQNMSNAGPLNFERYLKRKR